MGYDLHITRKEHWADEDGNQNISMDEWKDYVASDPEMRLDNFAIASIGGNNSIRSEREGLCVWTTYSGDGKKGNHAWFDYFAGAIDCKNPDEEIINKMFEIANKLGAKVQGDDGEICQRSSDGKITFGFMETGKPNEVTIKKAWWKFW